MIDLSFVDANILVYAHSPAEPLKREVARALLNRLWADQTGRTSVQVLNEFYVAMLREAAWPEVEEFFQWKPQQLDGDVLRRARQIEQRFAFSWWDCLVVAAAQQQGCSRLYTEDLQHGAMLDGLRVVNPFVSEVQEEPAAYRVAAASQHRPRGRPRKLA